MPYENILSLCAEVLTVRALRLGLDGTIGNRFDLLEKEAAVMVGKVVRDVLDLASPMIRRPIKGNSDNNGASEMVVALEDAEAQGEDARPHPPSPSARRRHQGKFCLSSCVR
ncbi:hypothetical protein [Rhizobium rhizogenes]|uniref:hypothetical protein n=1 Tax=Rhizobium rhizogenes TaxID=359 RepID=UPI001573E9FD|nr:hypothetical protein [Rhizobium rhizogenes]NTH35979.1 hypothetical protein [Rhizobium rhizogenes]